MRVVNLLVLRQGVEFLFGEHDHVVPGMSDGFRGHCERGGADGLSQDVADADCQRRLALVDGGRAVQADHHRQVKLERKTCQHMMRDQLQPMFTKHAVFGEKPAVDRRP